MDTDDDVEDDDDDDDFQTFSKIQAWIRQRLVKMIKDLPSIFNALPNMVSA